MNKLTLAALLSTIAIAPSAFACDGLSVKDAHIVQGPPGAATLAGFATLHNAGSATLTVTGASSADFASAEFHMTHNMGGMVHMMHQDTLTVPAGGDLVLASGGTHLMLNGPKRTLKAGDSVKLTLQCGAASLPVSFAVTAP